MGGQRHSPTALHPRKTCYPLYRRLGEPQGRSGQVRKISHPPPGFDPRSIVSHYTDWAIPAPWCYTVYKEQIYKILQEKLLLLYTELGDVASISTLYGPEWKGIPPLCEVHKSKPVRTYVCLFAFSTSESFLSRAVSFCLICLLFREKSSIHVHMLTCSSVSSQCLPFWPETGEHQADITRWCNPSKRTEPEISSLCWSE
jgi:hypothetical protein